jgi:hypothetical protein
VLSEESPIEMRHSAAAKNEVMLVAKTLEEPDDVGLCSDQRLGERTCHVSPKIVGVVHLPHNIIDDKSPCLGVGLDDVVVIALDLQ